MPTLRAMRRRGYSASAVRDFIARVGVAKNESTADVALLESCVRDDLNRRLPRRMAVLKPLKLIIDNYPEGQVEQLSAVNNPEDPAAGTRQIPFSRVLHIEQDDFRENPPPKYHRLYPGNEVRLRYAYLIKCTHAVKAANGEITEIHATYDPQTRGGDAPDRRKVKSTIHWVSAEHAVAGEIRMYDRLFTKEDPEEGEEGFLGCLNPASLTTLSGYLEPGLANAKPGDGFQFERQGYFCVDTDSRPGKPVFNLTVTLKDAWARIEKKSR
jgi:glutaminyl-tRNA synthetase